LLTGNTIPIITIREILIASLGLLFIPRSIKLDITDIVGSGIKLLPPSGGALEESKETIHKLNSVSETISDIAKSYNEVAVAAVNKDGHEVERQNRKLFAEALYNNMEELSENILYDDLIYQDDIVLDVIYDKLEIQESITSEELIKTLEENNSYIIGIDSEDKEVKRSNRSGYS